MVMTTVEMALTSLAAPPTLLAAPVDTMNGSAPTETSAYQSHSSAMGKMTAKTTAMRWDVVSSLVTINLDHC